jgi:hypothetical protein
MDACIGERHHNSKLSKNDILEIRKLRKNGMVFREIGEIYKISMTVAHGICAKKRWSHVR